MRIRALIVDDEPLARAGLRDMLAAIDWVTVAGEASNGLAGVEAINSLRPDLVFLDIQMPGLLGTHVLRTVEHQPFVVFTTAHAQHAVSAFELGAIDYLLKPFGADRLATTLDRVRAAFGEPGMPTPLDRMREVLSDGPITRLFVRIGRTIVPVAVAHVEWIEAQGDYVTAHTGDARYLLHVSLARLEARLDPGRFVRIHRTHIVNLDYVAAFKQVGKGQLCAELTSGRQLPVSRNRAKDLRALGA